MDLLRKIRIVLINAIDAFLISRDVRKRLKAVIEQGLFEIVLQPIVRIDHYETVGYEALTRFHNGSRYPHCSPDEWFSEAKKVGLSDKLEISVIKAALQKLDMLPLSCYISINISPSCLINSVPEDVFSGIPLERVVIEITEHEPIHGYPHVKSLLKRLRDAGARLAVDDAGAGFASLWHVLQLKPDFIKLDMRLVRDIYMDDAKQKLISAITTFAVDIGSQVVAEGVENEEELESLVRLRVNMAQGYLLGAPKLSI